jgi:DNA-directed RNA polymerase subunit E'/Rpb7
MGKHNPDETPEERKKRKQAKKDSKKARKESGRHDKAETHTQESPKTSQVPSKSLSSCFIRKTVQILFSLYPADLGDIRQAIDRSLRQLLLRYVSGMDGVLLAYDGIRIDNQHAGIILNELPHVHYQIVVDVLIFSPKLEDELCGTVTECFESHVGLLIHHYFNASIGSEQLVEAGFSYDDEQCTWLHEDGSTLIAPDELVKFRVAKIHEAGGTISLEGVNPFVTYSL